MTLRWHNSQDYGLGTCVMILLTEIGLTHFTFKFLRRAYHVFIKKKREL
jgi:hypothetical protein